MMMVGEPGMHPAPWLLIEESTHVTNYLQFSPDPVHFSPDPVFFSPEPAYEDDDDDVPVDVYTCDEFRMYEFKIRRCNRGRSHDWTGCPYAHPGEKARRRDPRKYNYTGTSCPDFRKGNCRKGDACEFAHGVFECWLHPSRYRTQPCKDGTSCRRRVCFFAHTPEQLRVVQEPRSPRVESYDGSPLRKHSLEAYFPKGMLTSSPRSTLASPPVSPTSQSSPVVESMRQLKLGVVDTVQSSPWGVGVRGGWGGLCSLPVTPTGMEIGGGAGWVEGEKRVESGRALRAKMFERLSKEGGLEEGSGSTSAAPEVAWVAELVK